MNRWMVAGLALTVAVIGSAVWATWPGRALLPERVPVHWGISGEPDGFVARDDIAGPFWTAPAIMVVMVALGAGLPWLSPRQFAVDRFRPTWDYVWFVVAAMMAWIHAVLMIAAFVPGFDLPRWLTAGLFSAFAFMGNVLTRTRPNFWMGVRTPWTLASETVWLRTHRLAAWMFVGAGVGGVVCSLVGVPLVGLVFVLAAGLVPVVYSLVLYKSLERQGRL